MRPNSICQLMLGVAFLAGCQNNKSTDNPEILKQVVTGYFEGIASKDFEKMKAATTDDFVLYEDGEVWNNDSACRNIRKSLPFTVKYKLDNFKINVDNYSGDATYSNHADFVFHDTVNLSLDWIESATFRKTPNGWKMNFLHLTVRKDIRYDTIRYAKEHYDKRVTLFKGEALTKGGIIFLGNSLTEYANWKEFLADSTVINRGIAGDNTFGVLDRLEDVIVRQPKKLFVEIGINDISQNIPITIILKNIFAIVAEVQAKSPGTNIYVHSILATNDNVKNKYPEVYHKNAEVKAVDQELQRNAKKKKNFTYIDLNTQVIDKYGQLDPKYAAPDGLHLNNAGYAVWVKLLKEKKYL